MLRHFRYTTLVTNTDDNRYIAMYIDRYNLPLVPLLWRTLRHPSVPQSWQKCREALRDVGSSFNKDKTESGCWELPPRCVWSSHINSLYAGALRSGIIVEKRSRENHTPGFSDCCLPGKWVGPNFCVNSMSGDDKPETEPADDPTDDAASFSSSSPSMSVILSLDCTSLGPVLLKLMPRQIPQEF